MADCDQSYGFLPCSTTRGGALFLVGAYGALLLRGANLIGDGGERLLDAGVAPSVVGGLFLPVTGALPDALIVLAAGFHGAAAHGRHAHRALREQVDVGVGALVGSTVMLLTVVYGGSILIGRCAVDPATGRAQDKAPPRLEQEACALLPERWRRWLLPEAADADADVERGGGGGGGAGAATAAPLREPLLPPHHRSSNNNNHRPHLHLLLAALGRAARAYVVAPLLLLVAGAVSTDRRTPAAARVMAASTLLWLLAELPVIVAAPFSARARAAASDWASLLGALLCFAALAWYCLSHAFLKTHTDDAEAAAAAAERGAARHYYLAAHRHALRVRAVRSFAWAAGARHGGLVDACGNVRPEATLALFRRFDRDGSGTIDAAELRALVIALEIARPGLDAAASPPDAPPALLPAALLRLAARTGGSAEEEGSKAKALGHPVLSDLELDAHVRAFMREFDRDRSGAIDFGEFHSGVERWVAYKNSVYADRRRAQQQQEQQHGAAAAAVVAPSSTAAADDASAGGGKASGAEAEQQHPPKPEDKAARRDAKRRALLDPVAAATAALTALDGDDAHPSSMAIPALRRASSSSGARGDPEGLRQYEQEEEDEQEGGREDEEEDVDGNGLALLSPASSLSRRSSGDGGGDNDSPNRNNAGAGPSSSSTLDSGGGGGASVPSSYSTSSSRDAPTTATPEPLCVTLALSAACFAAGTALCAAFAGPLVNALGDLATATGIPPFTLSFFLAPLASNASELVSSLRFAAGRKKERISATFAQVYGAVVMNNTLVLGCLLVVVHAHGLPLGRYAGEALLVAAPTLAVAFLGATRTTVRAWVALPLLAMYPAVLGLQYVMRRA